MASDTGNLGPTVERYGIDPGTAFGPVPTDTVSYGAREYTFDAGPEDGGSDGGDVGGAVNGPAVVDSGGDFERNADGSVKRNADGSPRRKRGRKPGGSRSSSGSRSSKTSSANVLTGDAIGALLVTACGVVSATLQAPELSMDEDEGKKIGLATANVVRHYDYVLTPKQYDTFVLAMALIPAIGLRAVMMVDRLKQERAANARRVNPKTAERPAPAPSTVPSPSAPASPGVNAAGAMPGAGFPPFTV